MITDFMKRRMAIKLGTVQPQGKKEPKPLKAISEKKAAQMAEEKKALNGDDTAKEKWFQARRKEMVGICQCGCAEPSSKNDDQNFRSCICHVFPQRLFKSIQFHPINWVERKFWASNSTGACHTNMDDKSIDLWPSFADWEDIKERFHSLAPCLTDEERKHKFYQHLEKLVYEN